MEGFLIRGCELILSGVRWLYVRSSANQRSASGTGVFYTVRYCFDPGDLRCRPKIVGVVKVLRISDPGMETYPARGVLALCTIPSQSATGQWGWVFHTVQGGFDPEDHRFRLQVVGVVDVWSEF